MKVWILIFVCMFSMPLLVAVLHFRMRKGQILKIRQDYVKREELQKRLKDDEAFLPWWKKPFRK